MHIGLVLDTGIPAASGAWTSTRTRHGYGFGATGTGSVRVFQEYHQKHAKNPKFRVFEVVFDL